MQSHIEYIHEEQIKFCTAFQQQFKRFSDGCQLPITHSVFKQYLESPPASAWWKFVAKWYDWRNINELLQQNILYHQQNSFFTSN